MVKLGEFRETFIHDFRSEYGNPEPISGVKPEQVQRLGDYTRCPAQRDQSAQHPIQVRDHPELVEG